MQIKKLSSALVAGSTLAFSLALMSNAQAADRSSDVKYKFSVHGGTCLGVGTVLYEHYTKKPLPANYNITSTNNIVVDINYTDNKNKTLTSQILLPCDSIVTKEWTAKDVMQINSYSIKLDHTFNLPGERIISSSKTPICAGTRVNKNDKKHRLYENVNIDIPVPKEYPPVAIWTHGDKKSATTNPDGGDDLNAFLCRTYEGNQ